jgi:O-antigen/teichoic acid export membrane protein
MKNGILSAIFGLLTILAACGIAKATNAGVWLACVGAFVVFGLLSYAYGEEAGR